MTANSQEIAGSIAAASGSVTESGESPCPVREARGGTLILGGGFAGASVAMMLGKRGATIVNPDNFMLYTPMLPEAASGLIDSRHVVVPLRVMCPHAEVLLAYASGLDEATNTVTVATDEGEQQIHYETLIIALGAITRLFPIPGLVEHTLPFKTLPDAINLRNHVLGQLEDAIVSVSESHRAKHLTFVFVGGGYSGVESCAEMKDLVDEALRHYPDLKKTPQRWVLVDGAPHILGMLPKSLSAYAHKHLTEDGIEIRSGVHLQEVQEDALVLSDGVRIEAGTIVWAAGVQPHPLLKELGLPLDDQKRVTVDEYLRVEGRQNVYALGDCARVKNLATPDKPDPPTCQHALRQAKRLAKNLKGQNKPYNFKTLGQVAQLGRYKGVSETVGVKMRGFMGWFIARAYHLFAFPLMQRQIRIMIDWALGMVFRRDIVQLDRPPRKGHAQPATRHEAMATGTFFEDVVGNVSGAMGAIRLKQEELLKKLMSLFDNPQMGGLQGLVRLFQEKGLDDVAASWVSAGKNLPISADQVRQVLGAERIEQLVSGFGLSVDAASSALANLLPDVVKQLATRSSAPGGAALEPAAADPKDTVAKA